MDCKRCNGFLEEDESSRKIKRFLTKFGKLIYGFCRGHLRNASSSVSPSPSSILFLFLNFDVSIDGDPSFIRCALFCCTKINIKIKSSGHIQLSKSSLKIIISNINP